MKVLTLHQPWASLIALGVKTIETRSMNTNVRGRIAIHAALKVPDFDTMKTVVVDNLDAWNAWHAAGLVQSAGRVGSGPLGSIVATATLVDCVPMVGEYSEDRPILHLETDGGGTSGWVWQRGRPGWPYEEAWNVRDQLPFGDFASGRFAWILDDIEPLAEPVPFRGGQGWSREWEST